jgi:hypothetical protein
MLDAPSGAQSGESLVKAPLTADECRALMRGFIRRISNLAAEMKRAPNQLAITKLTAVGRLLDIHRRALVDAYAMTRPLEEKEIAARMEAIERRLDGRGQGSRRSHAEERAH